MKTSSPALLQRSRWRLLAAAAAVPLLAAAAWLAVLLLDPALAAPAAPAAAATTDPALQAAAAQARQLLAWLNVVPVLLGAVLLWLLGGRLLLAAWCSAWLLWLLYQADALKIEHLHRHLSPGDLHLLPQLVSNSALFVRYLPWGGWMVAMLVPVLAATAALAWWEPRTLPRLRWRLLLLLPMLLLAATLLRGDGFWRAHYSDAALAGFHVWSPDRSIERSGLPAGLLRLGWESGVSTPAADPDLLRAFEHEHAAALAWRGSRSGPLWLPDIVVVQSEALFDPARLRGLDPADVLPHWRRLAANGVHGNLQVPAYGGGTIRTEFEVLTGVPLSAFPQVAYPYFGLAMRPLPSLPRALAALGYRTTVLHPFRRAFWNRDTALRRLGVAESVFEGDALLRGAARSGYYTSDKALYAATLAALEDTEHGPDLANEGRPRFALVITIENHSPWHARRPLADAAERDAIAVPGSLPPELRRELQTYLMHVQQGDAALGAFGDALLARSRPTLLLVYGDHLPGLGAVFDLLGFDDDAAPWEQPVPYFVAANFALPGLQLDLHAHDLPGLLLDLLELPATGYLALNARVRELQQHAGAPHDAQVREVLHHAAWTVLAGDAPADALPLPGQQLPLQPAAPAEFTAAAAWPVRGNTPY